MRFSLYRLAFFFAALALGSCDNAGPEPDAFSFQPLPDGAALFAPAAGGAAGDAFDPGVGGGRPEPAAFGCYLSSPNLGAPTAERYRLDRTAVQFPRDVLARAGGRSRVVVLTFGSPTLYAEAPRDTPTVVRKARCLVPDDDEAVELLKGALGRFEDDGTVLWEGEPMRPARSSDVAASSAGVTGTTAGFAVGAPTSVTGASASMTGSTTSCTSVTTEYWTVRCSPETGECVHQKDFEDTTWSCVQVSELSIEGDDPGTGAGGTGSATAEPCAGGVGYMPTTDQDGLRCERQDLWPRVEARSVHDWYGRCDGQSTSTDKAAEQARNTLFERNVVQTFGATRDTRNGQGYRELDGFKTHNGYLTHIYEVKNVQSAYAFRDDQVDQALAHLQRLADHREALRQRAADAGWVLEITSPVYTVITTSPHAPKLDYHGKIFAEARRLGISLKVYHPRAQSLFDWYLDGHWLNRVGGRIGDWYVGIPYGALPDWTRWVDPSDELPNEGFTADCTPTPPAAPAPDPPAL